MITTILTTSYRRPILLKRLADVIVPLINKQNGKLKWRIVIDEITNNYDFVFEEIKKKIKDINLITWSYHENIGKYRSLSKIFNENSDSDWLVNIDDDDIIINFKFDKIIQKLDSIDQNIKGIIFPRLILSQKFYHSLLSKKKKLFLKFDKQKMSYFDFKDKFGDFDTTIFVRRDFYKEELRIEIENDKFTPESLRWLDTFPNEDILIINETIIYSQYLYDGITKFTDNNRVFNYNSAIITYKKFLDCKKFKFSEIFIKSLVNYYRFTIHSGKKISIFKYYYGNFFIHFFCLTLAIIFFFKDIIFVKRLK